MIEIGEDNTPSLRDIEQPGHPPTRRLVVQSSPGRIYFASIVAHRTGIHADLHPADDSAINQAIAEITTLVHCQRIGAIEETFSGNPLRHLSIAPSGQRSQTLVTVGVLTAPAGIETPSDAELRQFFAFLSRCHPL